MAETDDEFDRPAHDDPHGSGLDDQRGGSELDDPRGNSIVALAGATGGTGTTRTAVELATTLARDGRSAVVVDASFATQGLSEYVAGRIVPDVTALVTDSTTEPLSAATIEFTGARTGTDEDGVSDLPGTVELLPAHAPFERLARAKTPEAARRFEELLEDAAAAFDRVIIDVPPVASNQAIAAVTAADAVVAVAPDGTHGRDALVRLRDRLADLDVRVDAAVSVENGLGNGDGGGDGNGSGDGDGEDGFPVAAMSLPATDPSPLEAPSCLRDDRYGRGLASLAEESFGVSIDVAFEPDRLRDRVIAAVEDRMESASSTD